MIKFRNCTRDDASSLSVVQLEAVGSVFTEATDMFNKMAATRTSSLAQHRNNLLPIHRIPFEVMTQVFWYSSAGLPMDWSPDCSTTDYKAMQTLARTCKRWQDIIRLTPTLWSWIDCRIAVWRIALKNSRAGLIDVLLPSGPIRSQMLIDRILPLTRRYRRLLLVDPYLGPMEKYLFHQPLTNLRTLSATATQYRPMITLPKEAPVLTAIYATNVIFRHNPLSTSLSSLSILHVDANNAGAWMPTIEVMRHSPKLRDVSINDSSLQDVSLPEYNRILLTELAELKLQGSPKCVLAVMSSIEVRAINSLDVMVSLTAINGWELCMDLLEGLPSWSVLPSSLLRLTQNGLPLVIRTRRGGLSYGHYTAVIGVDRGLQSGWASVNFALRGYASQCLWDTLRRKPWSLFPPNVDIKIHSIPREMPHDLPTIYSNLPNLVHAALPLHVRTIRQLSTPPDPQTGDLPCPKLASFTIVPSKPFHSLDRDMRQALKDLIVARTKDEQTVSIVRDLEKLDGIEQFSYQDYKDLQ